MSAKTSTVVTLTACNLCDQYHKRGAACPNVIGPIADRLTLADMARLQTWPAQRADESLTAYGQRVLTFVLAWSITAPLSQSDLELADHTAQSALANRDISPLASDRINDCRHLIASILRGRARESASTESTSSAARPPSLRSPGPNPEPNTDGGTKVPTHPVPLAPAPATHAVADFNF